MSEHPSKPKSMPPKTEMTSADVVDLYIELHKLKIDIRIDGGWSVDALLGEQTRLHEDLDIVIQQKDVPQLREFLEERGYSDVIRDDTSDWNFVLGDNAGHQVDVHVIVFDDEGNGMYGPAEKGMMYPAASLTGNGSIDGHPVKCISPEYMVQFHTGYTITDNDIHDITALCERFGMEYPKEYKNLRD